MLISKQAIDCYLNGDCDNFDWIKEYSREDILKRFKRITEFKTNPYDYQLACFLLGVIYDQFLFLLASLHYITNC